MPGLAAIRSPGLPSTSAQKPSSGGPSAGQRLDRDVLSLSGVSAVIWLEGINDFGRGVDAPVDVVTAAMAEIVARLRTRIPTVTVVGATVVSALHSTNGAHGSEAEDQKRRALNTFIRTSGLFDAVADFDAATLDPATGELNPEFVPESTTGGSGDHLHPNRAGYMAMAGTVDLGKNHGPFDGGGQQFEVVPRARCGRSRPGDMRGCPHRRAARSRGCILYTS